MDWNRNELRTFQGIHAFVGNPVSGINGLLKNRQAACFSSFARRPRTVARRARYSQLVCMGPKEPSEPPEPSSEGKDIADEYLKRDLERLYRESPSEWPPKDNYDEKVLGDIQTTGMKGIEKIAGALKEELTDVDAATEKYAKDLVDDEMGKVLTQYQEKQEQLLESQKLQVEEIRKQAKLIHELASSVQNPSETKRQRARETILLSLSGLFGTAALYYFWSGITENSSAYLQNAAVDAVVAAFIAFLSSSSFARGKSDDANNST